ncbi:PQQ-dependent sugar dehydrogenase [Adhaeretor mobilis]|nr:PQQ-dependent sugar dehydrogenase [Adhaeretor mobilis]
MKYSIHCLTLVAALVAASQSAFGQTDPLPPPHDARDYSGGTLHLKMYADPGSDTRLNSMASQPTNTGNNNAFLVTQEGHVYEIADNGSGQGTSTVWFDYDDAIAQAVGNTNGYERSGSGGQNGLQGIAFHPEFAINGKFYTSTMVSNSSNVGGFNYLGTNFNNTNPDGVVAEWTYSSASGEVDPSSYRELFRTQLPENDHPLKLPQFDPFAQPGDENYGLLFITHGDGDSQNQGGVTDGRAQDLENALGKSLRINPLEDTVNNTPYSVPATNPFVGTPNALGEIWTSGHRNPHTFSFAQDAQGESRIIVGEISFERIEEINLLQPGGDYGWNDREGTFVSNSDRSVSPLPSNDAALNDYVYPAAQYDHLFEDTGSGDAVAGGFVVDIGAVDVGEVALDGQYVFADFSTSNGYVYHTGFVDMLNAKTQLEDGDAPSELTQAMISRLELTLDEDGDGDVDVSGGSLQDIFAGRLPGNGRTDVRFGLGPRGELFMTSKQTGEVYLVTNAESPDSLPPAEVNLALQVNRRTGATSIINPATGESVELDGYLITSADNTLDPAAWTSLTDASEPGWTEANPGANSLGELNLDGSSTLAVDASIDLGAIYDFTPTAFAEEGPGVIFEYHVPDGLSGEGETRFGQVQFVGPLNNVVLLVDPDTGEVALQNQSLFDLEIDGYLITSESGSLDPSSWDSLEDNVGNGWTESNPGDKHIGELIFDGSFDLEAEGLAMSLGSIFDFDGIVQDLELEFHLAGGDTIAGIVQYGAFSLTPGDFNGDGAVDSADFLVWQRNGLSASELSDWQSNYGQSASQAAANTAVPEPSASVLLLLGTVGFACRRR